MGGLVGDDGDAEAPVVAAADHERDRVRARTVADVDGEALGAESTRDVREQPVPRRGLGALGRHGGGRDRDHQLAQAVDPVALGALGDRGEVVGAERGDHGEPLVARHDGLGERVRAPLLGQHAQARGQGALGVARVAGRQDDLVGVDARGVAERHHGDGFGQARAPLLEGVAQARGVELVAGGHHDGAARQRVDDAVGVLDDGGDLGARGLHGAGAGHGRAARVEHGDVECVRLAGRGQRAERAAVGEGAEHPAHARVARLGQGVQRHARQHAREHGHGGAGRGLRVSDHHDLAGAGERGDGLGERERLSAEHDREVQATRRRGEPRHLLGGRERDRAQRAHERRVVAPQVAVGRVGALDQGREQVAREVGVAGDRDAAALRDGAHERAHARGGEVAVACEELLDHAADGALLGQARVGRHDRVERRGPPRELEVAAHLLGGRVARGELGEQRAQACGVEVALDGHLLGGLEGAGHALREALEHLAHALPRLVEQVGLARHLRDGPGDARPQAQHVLDAVGVEVEVVGHHGPAAGGAVGAPAQRLRVGGGEVLVEVVLGAAGAQQLDGAAAQRATVAARELARLRRAGRRGGGHQVVQRAVEHRGREDLEGVAQVGEQPDLLGPRGDGAGLVHAGLVRRDLRLGAHLRQVPHHERRERLVEARALRGVGRDLVPPGHEHDGGGLGRRRLLVRGRLGPQPLDHGERDGRETVLGDQRGRLGAQPQLRLRRGRGGDEPHDRLDGVVRAHVPGTMRAVERVEARLELVAGVEQALAGPAQVLVVDVLDAHGHRREQAAPGGLVPRGDRAGDVRVGRADVVEAPGDGPHRLLGAADGHDGAAGRGGVGDDGGDGAHGVGPGRRLEEHGAAGGDEVERRELGVVQVTDAALGERVAVALRERRERLREHRLGVAVARGRGEHVGGADDGVHVVQVVEEALLRVVERAHEQPVGDVDAGERLVERADVLPQGAGVELEARPRLRGHGGEPGVDAAGAGLGQEHGVDGDGVEHRQQHVALAAGLEVHGPHDERHLATAGVLVPRDGADHHRCGPHAGRGLDAVRALADHAQAVQGLGVVLGVADERGERGGAAREERREAAGVRAAQVDDGGLAQREVPQGRHGRQLLELLPPFAKGVRDERAPDVVDHRPTVTVGSRCEGPPRRLAGHRERAAIHASRTLRKKGQCAPTFAADTHCWEDSGTPPGPASNRWTKPDVNARIVPYRGRRSASRRGGTTTPAAAMSARARRRLRSTPATPIAHGMSRVAKATR